MKLVVFSSKLVWANPESPSGYSTDGGFAFQMAAISQIFDEIIIVVPFSKNRFIDGEVNIEGHNLKVYPLANIKGHGLKRKMYYIPWLLRNIFIFNNLINSADAVHTPIPSDMGTLGMVLAKLKNKPLFVRYCGNWLVQRTRAMKFWKWFMEKYAGGKNVMLATGLQYGAPSKKNPNIKWIFSSSLSRLEMINLKRGLPRLDIKDPRLIIVCRIEERKGVDKVIMAVNLIKDNYPTIHLDVVGKGQELEKLRNMVNELNLYKNVTFHGKLNHENVLNTLKGAHIFCYPTTASEGFPKVVLESLAAGLPVFGTPVSAIKALLKGGGGVVLEDAKPETLAWELKNLLLHPEKYILMQQEALNTAMGFSLEDWRDTIKLYLQNAWGL